MSDLNKPLFHVIVEDTSNGHRKYEIFIDYSMAKLVKITSLVGLFMTFTATLAKFFL